MGGGSTRSITSKLAGVVAAQRQTDYAGDYNTRRRKHTPNISYMHPRISVTRHVPEDEQAERYCYRHTTTI